MTKITHEEELRRKADPRYFEIPQPCTHCKNIVTVGSQFDAEGWTCKAFPDQIPYSILTQREPHTVPVLPQRGDNVYVYDPVIYTEEHTGRQWHYTADARWVYVDGKGDKEAEEA